MLKKNKKDPEIFSAKPITGVGREVDKEIKESLKTIYRTTKGESVDITRLDSHIGRGFFYYFNRIATALILIGVLYLGYQYVRALFFTPDNSEVTLTIDAPSAITSGDEVDLVLEYYNPLNVALTDTEITFRPPQNFSLLETVPESSDEDGHVWKITGIDAGERGRITIRGRLYGAIGETFSMEGTLVYQPENFSSSFEAKASALMQIAATRFVVEKSFPAQAVVGEDASYKLQLFLADESDEETVVKVVPHFPEGFELTSGSENFLTGEEAWLVKGLTTKDAKPVNEDAIPTVEFSGRFTDDREQEQVVRIDYFVQAADENFYLEKKDEMVTQMVQGEFIVSLILNGESSTKAVNLGETLNYSLTYKNQSASNARDVSVSLVLPSGYIDYDSLIAIPGGIRKDDTITWTKEEIPELEELKPNDSGTIDITANLKEVLTGEAAASFTSEAFAHIAFFNDIEANIEVKSNSIDSPINSDLNWRISARYYNDDDIPVGTGPMPPQVGKTTTLHIFWRLTSSSHTVSSIKVRGRLPANVRWTGRNNATVGTLSFDESSRAVTWGIDRLNKSGGEVIADFEVAVSPTFDDVNRIILLMPAPTLTGLDQDTQGEIRLDGKPVTTDLDDDPVLSGRGLVES